MAMMMVMMIIMGARVGKCSKMLVLPTEMAATGRKRPSRPEWLILRGEGYILIRNRDIICIYYIQKIGVEDLHALRPGASADF